MNGSEADAVESLRRLGLSKYEAQVFIALQKLGTGTASDVDRVADVPRSQVYGAAEGLEERGLVEVRQANPIQYRPVSLDEARERLRARLERDQNRAFGYLGSVQGQLGERNEEQEAVWTIGGHDTVSDRVAQLARGADEYVVYGTGAELLDDGTVEALTDAAAGGVDVTVVSSDVPVLDRFAGVPGVRPVRPPDDPVLDREALVARVLVVDGDTVLLSVLDESTAGEREESAIWSAGTAFAGVFVQLIDGWLGDALDL